MQNIELLKIISIFQYKSENFSFNNSQSKIDFLELNSLPYLEIENFSITTLNKNEISLKILNNNIEINKISNANVHLYLVDIDFDGKVKKSFKFYKGYVSSFTIYNTFIEIKVLNLLTKLNQSRIGTFFSKTCRAEFGDNKCNFDLSKNYEILLIDSFNQEDRIECVPLLKKIEQINLKKFTFGLFVLFEKSKIDINKLTNSFYINRLIYNEISYKNIYQILSIESYEKIIIKISDNLGLIDFQNYYVILIRYCDKTIQSCSDFFNNAQNFRGEPYINEKWNWREFS